MLSIVVTVRLSRAGRGQPVGVAQAHAHARVRSGGAHGRAASAPPFAGDNDSAVALAVQMIALVAACAFLLGLEPPQIVRASWRQPEQQRLQEAIRGLMTLATTRAEVAQRVLDPVAGLVGASEAAIYDGDGRLLARQARPGTHVNAEPVLVEEPGVVLKVWTSPYAPFFGEDELRNLHTVAALTGIALDRVRLFEQEHQSRLALERANELMTNFVALAAHELRTPVTTVHGFVQTLNHLDDRLDEARKQELRIALEQQTQRMASLVEQLLDLSRLDAEAVEVRPQRFDLRLRLHEVVEVAAGARATDVEVEVAGARTVSVDPSIVDHIVTNLVTNALRYGQAPVRVLRPGGRRPGANRGRGRRAGCRRGDRGDALRAIHACRRRPRPRRRHRPRARDRTCLRARPPRRPSLRARPAERRALRGRAADRLSSFL